MRDVVQEPLTEDDIVQLSTRAGGLEALLSTRSKAYRSLKDVTFGEEAWIRAMARQPRLIRRPLLLTERGMAIGFDAQTWRALL